MLRWVSLGPAPATGFLMPCGGWSDLNTQGEEWYRPWKSLHYVALHFVSLYAGRVFRVQGPCAASTVCVRGMVK